MKSQNLRKVNKCEEEIWIYWVFPHAAVQDRTDWKSQMFCIELNSSCVCSNHRKHLHSICQENNDLWDGLDNAKSILNHCHILQEKHDLTDLINRPYYCEDYSGSGSEFCKIKDCCLALAFQSRARIQLEQYIKYTVKEYIYNRQIQKALIYNWGEK